MVTPYFHLYKSDSNAQWYWQIKAINHKIIADGSEGYMQRLSAIGGIRLIQSSLPIWDSSTRNWLQ